MRKTIRTNVQTNEIEKFDSVQEAAEASGVSSEDVTRCLKREIAQVNGYTFRKERFPQETYITLKS